MSALIMSLWIVIFLSTLFVSLFLYFIYYPGLLYAQWMIPPMPSPFPPPYTTTCCNSATNSSDIKPPEISLLTDKLSEGNNVIKLKILDESPLKMRAISYSVGNQTITTYLAKEHNNEYRALLKVLPPSTKVEVTAIDLNGNYAKMVKELKVEKSFTVFFNIANISNWKNLIFGDKKH